MISSSRHVMFAVIDTIIRWLLAAFMHMGEGKLGELLTGVWSTGVFTTVIRFLTHQTSPIFFWSSNAISVIKAITTSSYQQLAPNETKFDQSLSQTSAQLVHHWEW